MAIANDLEVHLLALSLAGRRPVILDAHEYSPCEFEDKLVWRLTRQGFSQHLSSRYLNRAAAMITACDGIALEYRRNFAVEPAVVPNAAPFHDLPLRTTSPVQIRLIHHGGAIASRRIEEMIDMMDLVDEHFSLDLILVPGDPLYIARIRQRAAGNLKVCFLDPVPMNKLVELSAGYDVGLFLLPPTNLNYAMAAPTSSLSSSRRALRWRLALHQR